MVSRNFPGRREERRDILGTEVKLGMFGKLKTILNGWNIR